MARNSKRYQLIDEYRGFVVVNMILFHLIWDFIHIYHKNWDWLYFTDHKAWQIFIGGSFIFISGLCFKMGTQPFKRGLIVFLLGIVITLFTSCFMPSTKIVFGVLTLLGTCMLLMIPLSKLLRRIKPWMGLLISIALFLFTFGINDGYFGIPDYKLFDVPSNWYANIVTTFLGFPEPDFFSTDYYSFFPWFFLYLVGYFSHPLLTKGRKRRKVLSFSICPPLGYVGRHALLIYLLHQPIIYGVLLACSKIGLL